MKHLFLAAIGIALSYHAYAQLDTFDINTNTSGVISSYPSSLFSYNSNLYFTGFEQASGCELRMFEKGKTKSTNVSDLRQGPISSTVGAYKIIGALNNVIYFTAADTQANYEVWSYDGTTTKLAAEINPRRDRGSGPDMYTVFDEKLFFAAADDTHGKELHYYDPISKQATMIQDLNPGTGHSTFFAMQEYNGKLYLACSSGPSTNVELHVYNPVEKKLLLVQDLRVGPLGSMTRHMTVAGGKLYFIASDGNTGYDLYSYDGTGPIKRVTDLQPGRGNGVTPYDFRTMITEYNGSLYFDGYDPSIGFYQLCEYNLTTEKITYHPLTSSNNGNSTNDYTIYNNKLFFAASDGTHGIELWSYDGTNKPVQVADVAAGSASSKPKYLTVADGYLYFSAEVHPIGEELFRYKESTSTVENVNSNINDVAVYPNPATNNIQLQFTSEESRDLEIIVTDIQGRVMYTKKRKAQANKGNTINIPCTNFASGTYICNVKDKSGRLLLTKNFVKQ